MLRFLPDELACADGEIAGQLLELDVEDVVWLVLLTVLEALQSGILYGFAGQVDALVDRVRDTVAGFDGDDVSVVATGFLAPLMFDECETLTAHHPYLTLDGLRLVYERSKQQRRR